MKNICTRLAKATIAWLTAPQLSPSPFDDVSIARRQSAAIVFGGWLPHAQIAVPRGFDPSDSNAGDIPLRRGLFLRFAARGLLLRATGVPVGLTIRGIVSGTIDAL